MALLKNIIGNHYESNNFGFFTVIEHVDNSYHNSSFYKIKFDNTGSETIASYEAIRHGRVRDKYAPVVAGVGYTGSFEGVISHPNIIIHYRPWNDMLHRCYNPNDKDYLYYGALGVTVDPRWFDFGIYFNDIQQLPGFNMKLRYPREYQLDKDYLQLHIPKSQRVYSKDTCIWLSKFDNMSVMNYDQLNEGCYPGVIYKDNSYIMRYYNKCYGRYTNPIAAANAYRHLHTISNLNNPFNNITLPANFPIMSMEEVIKYQKNPKIMCSIIDNGNVSSTTNPEMGVGLK